MERALVVLAVLALVAVVVAMLRNRSASRPRSLERRELGVAGRYAFVLLFSSPYCESCARWRAALEEARVPLTTVDVAERPDLAYRYRVPETPLVLGAGPDGEVLESYSGDPTPAAIDRLAVLAGAGPAAGPALRSGDLARRRGAAG